MGGGGGWRGDFSPQGWHPSPQPVSGQRSVRARVYGSVTVSVCVPRHGRQPQPHCTGTNQSVGLLLVRSSDQQRVVCGQAVPKRKSLTGRAFSVWLDPVCK